MDIFFFLEQQERISFLCSCDEAYEWGISKKNDSKHRLSVEVKTETLSKNPNASFVVDTLRNRSVETARVTVDSLGRIQGKLSFRDNVFFWKDGVLHGEYVTKKVQGESMYLLVERGSFDNGVRKPFYTSAQVRAPTYSF
uniref:Uncharacterized protein n=1 Tax=Marseillevirus sp. TaxID=2809551 RepID=A0AA96ERY6_9VIRU|nr:hypothetical protein MarFTMF_110 [Marseillevirus sp.]